jgi:large subunit ribosomal protein L35
MKQKLKTRKAAAKRVKITGTGKIMRGNIGKRHLLEHKAPGTKRQKRSATVVDATNVPAIKAMLPGAF